MELGTDAMKKWLFIIPLLVIIILYILLRIGQPQSIYNKNLDSILELKAYTSEENFCYGTAVVLNQDTIVTNAHLVSYIKSGKENIYEKFYVRTAKEEEYFEVQLDKYDEEIDLAVLKYDKSMKLKPIKISNKKLRYGDKIYAIGNGSNYGLSITTGTISNPLINVKYEDKIREAIQCDLTITSGNSGGALLDKYGRLIGITTFRTKDEKGNPVYGIAYSVPVKDVLNYVNE